MKTDEQDLIDLISRYLDNALSAQETGRLLEIIRADQTAADLLCELSIQHVQLHRLFKKDEVTVKRRNLSIAPVFSRFVPVRRPLALVAGLAIIIAAGFWLTGFLRDRYEPSGNAIVLLKIGADITAATDSKTALAGPMMVVPPKTIQLLRLKDGTVFQMEAGTKAQIVDTGSATSGITIKVMSGMVIADIAGQSADFPLQVMTPHVEVIVGGTRFSCKVEEDHTHVRMHHGCAHVICKHNGCRLKLNARHHVTAGERFRFHVRSIHEDEH